MRFAIVHNWPGQKNSELELIIRIRRIAKKLGHECSVIDPFGHPLTDKGEHLNKVKFINAHQYDFCLNLHYTNPNFINTFSYVVNWNPLDYVIRNPMDGSDLPLKEIAYRTACLNSHHMILSSGSDEMDDFVKAFNIYNPTQNIGNSLCLHTTSEVSEDVEFSAFNKFKVFYIGANWERQTNQKRHDGLIELLDSTNIIEFYGVEKQHGIYLWEGVENYKGELPFDGGKSIIKYSNRCGVSLVLHSTPHRDSGLVSTRIFQACAAKSLIICDDNPFIIKHFKDSVLSFKYTDDPSANFQNIMEKIEWIKKYPEAALSKAQKSHQIFKENFSLEKEIADLINNHHINVNKYFNALGVCDSTTSIDVIFIYKDNVENLKLFFSDLASQIHVKPRAVIYALPIYIDTIAVIAKEYTVEYEIIKLEDCKIDSLPLKGYLLTNYLNKIVKSKYFSFYSSQCQWHKFHLSYLTQTVKTGASIAMTGTFVRNNKFEELSNDYYSFAMSSIDGYFHGITKHDLAVFNAKRFTPTSLLFLSSSFKDQNLLRALSFFDNGWAFFLITWVYLQTKTLPSFYPKSTVMFKRKDNQWEIDSYKNGRQEEEFERSLAFSIFNSNPVYLSLVRDSKVFREFSINEKMNGVLQNRPILLSVYRRIGKAICLILKLPYQSL